MTKVTLFSIAESLTEIQKRLEENGGELTEADESLLDSLATDLAHKTTGVKEWLYQLEANQKYLKEVASHYSNQSKKIASALERFEGYILSCMDKLQVVEIGTKDKIKIRKPRMVLEIYDEDAIPIEYLERKEVVQTEILKDQIKKDLESGKQVPGAKLSMGKRSLLY